MSEIYDLRCGACTFGGKFITVEDEEQLRYCPACASFSHLRIERDKLLEEALSGLVKVAFDERV